MKALYFLPLLIFTASATPRIEQISPATGRIDGHPVAYDIDNDGDLDIAYLLLNTNPFSIPGVPPPSSSVSSTWLENLGNRQFSAPRTLGHHFSSSYRNSQSETLIQSPASPTATLIHHTIASLSGLHEIFSKSPASSSWQKIHEFEAHHRIHFLDSPHPNLPLIFSTTPSSQTITLWHNHPDSVAQIDQITLPASIDNEYPTHFQATDLDQDEDADLIFAFSDQTYIYEQISRLKFSPTPSVINISHPRIGDLDLDGQPDIYEFTSSSSKTAYLNHGNFIFTPVSLTTTPSNARTDASGNLGDQPIIIDTSFHIDIYQASSPLNFSTEIPLDFGSASSAFLLADFDQDGNSDLTFISNVNTPTAFTRTNQDFINVIDRVLIPGIPLTTPYYDQVLVSWGQQNSFTTPSPASTEAPIISDRPAIGDFNNDTFLDLIIGPDANGQAHILLNDGHGNFPTSRLLAELRPPGIPSDITYFQSYVPVDINGDSNLDLAFTISRIEASLLNNTSTQSSACAIALGDGSGSFLPVTVPLGSFSEISNGFCGILEFRDFDNDGDPDAILPGAWRENVNGTLRQSIYPLIQNTASSDALGNPITVVSQQITDLDGDGFLDIFIPALTTAPFDPFQPGLGGGLSNRFLPGLAFNSGNRAIQEVSEFPGNLLIADALGNPTILPYLALDLNLDGRAEILTSDPTTDALGNPISLRIICQKLDPISPRDISLTQTTPYPTFSLPLTDQLLDFNGDGELEYVAGDQYITPTIRGPLISPKYNFRGDHIYTTYNSPKIIAVQDFDNDGDTDALYANGFSGLHLVRNTIVDEDSPITSLLINQGLTPAQSSPEADPDGDGRSNALELIQGSDPLVADTASPEFLAATLSYDGSYLYFQQRTDAADLDLYYDVEISDDLINWTRVPSPLPGSLSSQGIWEQVAVAITRHPSDRYYRISTTHDPRR